MCAYKIVLAVAMLVPLAIPGSAWVGRCSSNNACPTGSECVDNSCFLCIVDQAKCIRSMDRCKKLNCPSDQGCYVSETANNDSGVTLKLGCFPNNPCAGVTCQTGTCHVTEIGNQPPIAQCRPIFPANPCNGANCPSGSRCLKRSALCDSHDCIVEGICVDSDDCVSCNYSYQYCEITVQNNNVQGTCVNFRQPFIHRPFPSG